MSLRGRMISRTALPSGQTGRSLPYRSAMSARVLKPWAGGLRLARTNGVFPYSRATWLSARSCSVNGRLMTAASMAPAASALIPPLLPMLGSTTTETPGAPLANSSARIRKAPSPEPVPPIVRVSATARKGANAMTRKLSAASGRFRRLGRLLRLRFALATERNGIGNFQNGEFNADAARALCRKQRKKIQQPASKPPAVSPDSPSAATAVFPWLRRRARSGDAGVGPSCRQKQRLKIA